jgi:hypothetical protein
MAVKRPIGEDDARFRLSVGADAGEVAMGRPMTGECLASLGEFRLILKGAPAVSPAF